MTERRFSQSPDSPLITPEVRALDAEARTLLDRCKVAVQQRQALESEFTLAAAKKDDARAAATAVRSGKPAASAGSPAMDMLAAAKVGAEQEIDGISAAVADVELEIQTIFEKAVADDRASGRAALKSTEQTYRKAVAALSAARSEFTRAKSIERWLAAAASGSNSQSKPQPPAWPTATSSHPSRENSASP